MNQKRDEVEEARFEIRKAITAVGADLESVLGPWAREEARLNELYYAVLAAVSDVDKFVLHDLIERMYAMALLEPEALAALHGDDLDAAPGAARMRKVMAEAGVSDEAAQRAVRAWVAVAHGLCERHGGRVQRYLRQYGERILAEASSTFPGTELSGAELRNAFTLWLQNCLNMPLLLVDDTIEAFCQTHGITTAALIDGADSMNLYLAVLDDLLRLQAGKASAL
jgi:hypothetical protein